MWEGFTSGLSNLGSSIGNLFSSGGLGMSQSAMSQLPSLSNMGVDVSGLTTSQATNPSLFGGMMDFVTSKQGQGLMNTGIGGFNALNSYNTGKHSMNLANKQMDMQQDAYNTDKLNAEARKNLRF